MQITRFGVDTRAGPSDWFTGAPFMTHLAMLEVDEDGNAATWGEAVSDDDYGSPPSDA